MLLALGRRSVAQDDTIKVDVDLVNVLCTVRAKNNALVGGLEKGDFHLFEDGKEQDIKYFTRETDLPLTIGLLVDVSGSQERLIDTEHRAASAVLPFGAACQGSGVPDQLRQGCGASAGFDQFAQAAGRRTEAVASERARRRAASGPGARPSRIRRARFCGTPCTWLQTRGSRARRAAR